MKTIKDVFGRLRILVIKLISIKGIAFMVASVALIRGTIDSSWWVAITGLVIGTRAAEKWLLPRMPKIDE